MKQSAGLVVYCRRDHHLVVLLVHPSGNYNRHKPWSIPKGLVDEGESLVEAALRETAEEAGIALGKTTADVVAPLGTIDYTRSRKRIHAFAVEAAADAAPSPASWEIDRAEFVPLDEARQIIHPEQLPFLDRLCALLGDE